MGRKHKRKMSLYSYDAISLKEFWRLNIRLQNIQKFPGRQHKICIENLFRSPSHGQLTFQLLFSLKPAWYFLLERKGSGWDGKGREGEKRGEEEKKERKNTSINHHH